APGCAGHIPTVSAWGLVLLALLLLIAGKLLFGRTQRVAR
ncbi:MAG: IPTL-CTERM sorting domain-containing protein, partial [Phycisphaerales bacterium]